MSLLYFWRRDNYERDLDEGVAFHLNQSSAKLHSVDLGGSVWAFTRNAKGRYVLAAELIVHAKTRNPEGYQYGPFRVWGDRSRSRYFAIDDGPNVEPLIRTFALSMGDGVLGRSFQGPGAVRSIAPMDHAALAVFARDLPLEPRAHGVNEEQLELLLARPQPEVITETIYTLPGGMSAARRRTIVRDVAVRSRANVEDLRTLYRGRCQVCEWESRAAHSVDVCEGHHLQWLSRGGSDAMSNMVLLCPNYHRLVHALDAPLDFSDLSFDLGTQRAPLRLTDHLRPLISPSPSS